VRAPEGNGLKLSHKPKEIKKKVGTVSELVGLLDNWRLG
jgi:hypothetical protein